MPTPNTDKPLHQLTPDERIQAAKQAAEAGDPELFCRIVAEISADADAFFDHQALLRGLIGKLADRGSTALIEFLYRSMLRHAALTTTLLQITVQRILAGKGGSYTRELLESDQAELRDLQKFALRLCESYGKFNKILAETDGAENERRTRDFNDPVFKNPAFGSLAAHITPAAKAAG